MTRRIVIREEPRKATFARALYDGTLPLDIVFAGGAAAQLRPRILASEDYGGLIPEEPEE